MIIHCIEIFQEVNIPIGDWLKSESAKKIFWLFVGFFVATLLTLIFKKPKFELASALSFVGRHKFALKYINKSVLFDLHNIHIDLSLVTTDSRFPRPIPIPLEENYAKKLYKRHFFKTDMCCDIIEFELDNDNMILFCNGGYIEVSISGETKFGSKRIKGKKFYLSSDAKVYQYQEGNSIKFRRNIREDSIGYKMKYAEYIDDSFYNAYIKNAEIIPMR